MNTHEDITKIQQYFDSKINKKMLNDNSNFDIDLQYGQIYEIGNGRSIKNVDFLKQIGYHKVLPIKKVKGESKSTCADNTAIKQLGW